MYIGYGYIKLGEIILYGFNVFEFIEKLDFEIVLKYVFFDKYFWNSGMFMFKVSCYIEELEKFNFIMLDVCKCVIEIEVLDFDFIWVDFEIFCICFDDLIDYVVMEKIDSVVMVFLDVGWSDVGSWKFFWEILEKDNYGNVCIGDIILENIINSYVNVEEWFILVIGLENVIVVEIKDVVMVVSKDDL